MTTGLVIRSVHVLVLVSGNQEITREGLRALLREDPACADVQAAHSLPNAEALAARTHPDVIFVGFGMPLCAIHATRRLRSIVPDSRVIVLSGYLREQGVAELLTAELRQAGALGLLPCDLPASELRQAFYLCLAGREVFPQGPIDRLPTLDEAPVLHPEFPADGDEDSQNSLTPRQVQVLKLIAKGLLSKEIANRLGISIKTVEKHRHRVKERLHAANTAGLTRRAIELGLA